MFDAYTVKKVLPRLVIAVILIQLSWFIFTGMITLINAIAYGVEGLIYAPFGGADSLKLADILSNAGGGANGIFTGLITGTVLVAGATLFLGGAFLLALSAFLALLVGFALLLFRQVIIVALLIISPIALVAWILPNTEKFWKMWWESFSKLLLVYPLILGVLAAGRAFAFIVAKVDPGPDANIFSNTGSNIGKVALIIIALFGPYFLIPKMFQMAGGAFVALKGLADNKTAPARAALRKASGAKRSEGIQRSKAGKYLKGNSRFANRVNARAQRISHLNKAGFRPGRWGTNIDTAVGATNKQTMERNRKENPDYDMWKNNDGLNRAAAESNNEAELRQELLRQRATINPNTGRAFYEGNDQQMEADISRVGRVRKQMGNSAFKQMAWHQAVAGGTAYANGAQAWRAAGVIANGDTAVLQDMVGQGRKEMNDAGRYDQGGGSFGGTVRLAQDLTANPGMTDAQGNQLLHRDVLESQGPGVLAHAGLKTQAVEQLIPEFRRRLQEAHDTGDQEVYDRELAQFASVYDGMGGDASNKARVLADGVMRWDPTTALDAPNLPPGSGTAHGPGNTTIQRDIEARRGSEVFQSTRRELNAQQQQQGGLNPGGPGPPAPGP